MKRFQTAALVALIGLFAVSCQSGNQDVRDAAREDVGAETVQPADPAAQGAQPQAAVPAGPTTTMEFAETTHDFGTVKEGEIVTHTFKFTNTGNEPLILSDAKGSCGCTVPNWPREAIAPGESGEIVVEFNSKNKQGKRNQKVTVTANTATPQTFIYLTGEVTPDPNKPASTSPNLQVQ